jgi:thiamine pyrophosphokinase
VLVLAGVGERLDHLVSALHVLGSPRYAATEVDARVGAAHVHVIRDVRALEGKPGELVSLFALHGTAEGVRTEGLEYPLAGETLEPGSSRGVSNRFVAEAARVRVERGILLAVRPGPETETPT